MLLPVREARTTLASALGDVLAQREVAVRVIAVVDTGADGRDDGTRERLLGLAREEPRLLVIDGPGRGAGAALDRALSAADADLVSHMEADDRCPPDRLARQLAALHARPELSAVTSRVGQFGARTPGMRRYLDWQNALLEHEAMRDERFVEIPALHQTGLYRRAALERVGGYAPRGPWPPDIDFWLRWFEHEELRVAKVARVLYRWRQHPRQSTRGGGAHALASLRAAKVAALARALGDREIALFSTGRTLQSWARELEDAGLRLVGAHEHRPGHSVPRVPDGVLVLCAYGSAKVRARLRRELAPRREPDELLFTA